MSTLTGTTVALDETVGLENDDTNAALPSVLGLASQSLEHDADLVLGRIVLARRPTNFPDRLLGPALACGCVSFIVISPLVWR